MTDKNIRRLIVWTAIVSAFFLCANLSVFSIGRKTTEWRRPPIGAQIDWSDPLTDDLVGLWLFNEGSGRVTKDYSMYSTPGVLMNFAAPPVPVDSGWNPGREGWQLHFDDVDDYVTMGDPATGHLDFNDESFSIALWFNPYILFSNEALVEKIVWENGTTGAGYIIYILTGGKVINFGMEDSVGASVNATGVTTLTPNRWHFVVCVRDEAKNTLLVYLDGQPDCTPVNDTTNGNFQNAVGFDLGRWGGSQAYNLDGAFESAFVWNRALSAHEVSMLYQDSYSFFIYSDLGGLWTLLSGASQVISVK